MVPRKWSAESTTLKLTENEIDRLVFDLDCNLVSLLIGDCTISFSNACLLASDA